MDFRSTNCGRSWQGAPICPGVLEPAAPHQKDEGDAYAPLLADSRDCSPNLPLDAFIMNAWTRSGYLFALSIVFSTGGCSNIVKPMRPPEGRALLKANVLKPSARDFGVGDLATCYKSMGGHSASVCNLNGTQRPEAIVKPTTGFESVGWTREVLPSGTMVAWGTAYPLQPGRQRLIVENDQEYCGDESRWRRWFKAGVGTGAVGLIITAIAENKGQQPALLIEFDADVGKSYLLECDINKTPWAWVTPEDQR